nr:hypothetical protein [Tanacetum cinerariifolium]
GHRPADYGAGGLGRHREAVGSRAAAAERGISQHGSTRRGGRRKQAGSRHARPRPGAARRRGAQLKRHAATRAQNGIGGQ